MFNKTLLSTHYLFSIRILLTVLGAIITYAYADASHYFWLISLPLFASLELLPYYLKVNSITHQQHRENILRWLGGLISAFFVFLLYWDGRLFHEETALIILFLLAFLLYLDCLKQPTMRSAFVVCLLFLLDLLLTFTDLSIGLLIILAVIGLVWSYIDQSKHISKLIKV